MLRTGLAWCGVACVVAMAIAARVSQPSWWLVAEFKAERVAINPSTGEVRPLPDVDLAGVKSPDGTRIAYVGSDPKSARDFDLFVADVDPQKPVIKSNSRMLSTGPEHERPGGMVWTPNSRGLVFLAGNPENQQVWYVDAITPQSPPVHLTDGQHPSSNLCVSSGGSIAYFTLMRSEGKQQFQDLTIIDRTSRTSDFSGAKRTTLVSGEHLTAMAFSPDGRRLAYAGINTMHVHDFSTQKASEIHYDAITPKLINHLVWDLSWRPDSQVIAAMLSFAGGILYEADKGPPRMFAENKIFLIPADWSAPAPTYDPKAEFPSPTIDKDADDQASPMPQDASRPGWINTPRGRVLRLEWIAAEQVPVAAASRPTEPN